VESNITSKDILNGDRRALAKAITLVESKKVEHRLQAQKIIEEILPHTGKSFRIGISGVPGVGKSTFIENFGQFLIQKGKKVAVLAVDPTSPVNGGSILGDKTRMENLSREENAFIRPSPNSAGLGGVASKTRECIFLCEAAGFDIILVETVGVGQSEISVSHMVDFFLLLMLPGAGDEIQGIKKGIIEMADTIIINKADGDNIKAAELAKNQLESALQLVSSKSFWKQKIFLCSSLEQTGFEETWSEIHKFFQDSTKNGHNQKLRKEQSGKWIEEILHLLIDEKLKNDSEISTAWKEGRKQVLENKKTPFHLAQQILEQMFK
jgi:LAO/AO transport system kinase